MYAIIGQCLRWQDAERESYTRDEDEHGQKEGRYHTARAEQGPENGFIRAFHHRQTLQTMQNRPRYNTTAIAYCVVVIAISGTLFPARNSAGITFGATANQVIV